MIPDWNNQKKFFPRLTRDVCLKQWGERCILIDKCTGRQLPVSVEAAFALSLCYGRFNLEQILDLVSSTFEITLPETEKEIKSVFEKCLKKEMFAVLPIHRPAAEPICDPRLILKEAAKGNYSHGLRYPSPVFLVVVLTERCNMSCIYCFRSSGEKKCDEISTEEWLDVVDQAASMGIVRCFITGGEPTLHDGFIAITSRLLEYGIYPYISTNGLGLSAGMIKTLADRGLKRIQVSLDAADEKLFYRLTGIDHGFSRVLENIQRLVSSNIEVMVKSVVMPLNYQHVKEIIKICYALGVKVIDLQPYGNAPFGRGGSNLLLSEQQRMDVLEVIREEKADFGQNMIIMQEGLERKIRWVDFPADCTSCAGFISSIVIQPNGDVGPCELLPTVESLKAGNIKEDTLSSLWNSPLAEQIAIPPKDKLDKVCSECEYLKHCRAGCRAYALLYSNNPFSADPRCSKAMHEDKPVMV